MKIPVLDQIPGKNKEPVVLSNPKVVNWTFSFRYWRQVDFFGLSGAESKWFVSLLEKLKELSYFEVEKFVEDSSQKSAWRYHPINWSQKNIPIKRDDLEWVDTQYLENEDEFPLLQFQISRALGRVVGFWDEKKIFNIVLLDPLHNIQPSKSHSYRVDKTGILGCEYSSIKRQLPWPV